MKRINNFDRHRILLIEDDGPLRSTIQDVLEAHEYEVFAAENGALGIDMACQISPDIIICDIMMPEMDGYQVVEKIRQKPDLDLVPFIFLTAKHTYLDVRKGMNLGADDYLVKPFRNQDLIEVIQIRLQKNERLVKAFFRHYQVLEKYGYMNSHEIRSPLSNIMGLVQMLDQNKEQDKNWIEMLKESAYQLDTIIRRANDLLGKEIDSVHFQKKD
ncbi:MAG: response regulator [Bacteroidia bacterium]|nr:response regulator [Bacteroidia bacterium]